MKNTDKALWKEVAKTWKALTKIERKEYYKVRIMLDSEKKEMADYWNDKKIT